MALDPTPTTSTASFEDVISELAESMASALPLYQQVAEAPAFQAELPGEDLAPPVAESDIVERRRRAARTELLNDQRKRGSV
tara:strand:+ start:440 stop:685 length:246 start_codon:yes stop_codon:yes gene_type:complete